MANTISTQRAEDNKTEAVNYDSAVFDSPSLGEGVSNDYQVLNTDGLNDIDIHSTSTLATESEGLGGDDLNGNDGNESELQFAESTSGWLDYLGDRQATPSMSRKTSPSQSSRSSIFDNVADNDDGENNDEENDDEKYIQMNETYLRMIKCLTDKLEASNFANDDFNDFYKYTGAILQLHENLKNANDIHNSLIYYKERNKVNRAMKETSRTGVGECAVNKKKENKKKKSCAVQTEHTAPNEDISGIVRREVSEYLSTILDEKHAMTERLSESVEYAIGAVKDCKEVMVSQLRIYDTHGCFVLKLAFCEIPQLGQPYAVTALSDTIKQKYIRAAEHRNISVSDYLNNNRVCQPDAGFDLFVPLDSVSNSQSRTHIDYGIKCAMFLNGRPCGYYLFARSSTGTRTPLRLANSVGIIDAGYRGNCISILDNIYGETYDIKSGDRLVQLCAPNMTYPFKVEIVSESELGVTERNDGGFGSTGR